MALTGRRARRAAQAYRLTQIAGRNAALVNAVNAAGGPPKPKPLPPLTAPPGSYDPALDAQERATQRGLGDLREDYARDFGENGAGGRAFNDYTLGVEDITRRIAQGREDYNTQRGDIRLGFQRLGRRQGEAARAHGVLSHGIAAMSAAARAANEGRDIGRVDTAETRFVDESNRDIAKLGLGYQRQVADAGTGLGRAERDAGQFGIDTTAAKLYQAQINGMLPPVRKRRRRGVLSQYSMR